jgi:hypothetical protein
MSRPCLHLQVFSLGQQATCPFAQRSCTWVFSRGGTMHQLHPLRNKKS